MDVMFMFLSERQCSMFGKANGQFPLMSEPSHGGPEQSCLPGGRRMYGGAFLPLGMWFSYPVSPFFQTQVSEVKKKFF